MQILQEPEWLAEPIKFNTP